MGGEVGLQPLVLRTGGRPVGGIVVRVDRAVARVGVGPVGLEHVEAGVAGIEGVPGARVGRRCGAVDAAVGLLDVLAAGGAGRDGLGPLHLLGAARPGGAGDPVVAAGREQRQRLPRSWPERRAEDGADVRRVLLQVAVVGLATRGVAVVADRHREPCAAGRDLLHEIGLIGVVAVGIGLAPVAEHVEGERLCRAGRDLGRERGSRGRTEQVGRVQERPVAVRAGRRQRDGRRPLILAHTVDGDRVPHAGHGVRGRAVAAHDRTPPHAARLRGLVRTPADRDRGAHGIGEVRGTRQVRIERGGVDTAHGRRRRGLGRSRGPGRRRRSLGGRRAVRPSPAPTPTALARAGQRARAEERDGQRRHSHGGEDLQAAAGRGLVGIHQKDLHAPELPSSTAQLLVRVLVWPRASFVNISTTASGSGVDFPFRVGACRRPRS